MKFRFIGFVLFLLFKSLLASFAESGTAVSLNNWAYSDESSALWGLEVPALNEGSWKSLNLPGTVPLNGGLVTLRCDVSVPSVLSAPVYLNFGKIDGALRVYVNGTLIGTQGSVGGERWRGYAASGNYSSAVFIPPALLTPNSTNRVTVQCASPGSFLVIPHITVASEEEIRFIDQFVNFLNFRLYSILAFLCAFIGLYFFALWIAHPSDKPNLWFALSSLFIAYYFLEMGSLYSSIDFTLNRALAKSCLSLSMAALVLFFVDFLKLAHRSVILWAVTILSLALTAGFIAVHGDLIKITGMFNVSLLFVQLVILYISINTVVAIVRGNKEALPILFGVILGVALGTHDVVYSMMGLRPLAWLQGLGFFALNLSLFLSLTIRSQRLHKELKLFAQEIETKEKKLTQYLEKIGQTTRDVSLITSQIDDSSHNASSAAEELILGTRKIQSNSQLYSAAVVDSKGALEHFSRSVNQVKDQVTAQTEMVRSAVTSINVVMEGVDSVEANVQETDRFVRSLDERTTAGLRSSQGMGEAIEKIKASSQEIVSIVETLEDFADRTNLLAMNAAIEAAHAGSSGRGFAIIANEIKNLASASSERASRIRDTVKEIVLRIGAGVDLNGELSSSLTSVFQDAEKLKASMIKVDQSLQSQRLATDELRNLLQRLSDEAERINTETQAQENEAEHFNRRIEEMVQASRDLDSAITRIAGENDRIVGTIKTLTEISGRGRQAVENLHELLEKR